MMRYLMYGYAIKPENGRIANYTIKEFEMKLEILCNIRHYGIFRGYLFIPYFEITETNREFIEHYIMNSTHAVCPTLFELDHDQLEKARNEVPRIFGRNEIAV